MSWVVEEWKEGLPTKSLQKIQELESQLDKLKKERQQKQFQLESLEAAFQKQKQKVESEKGEVTALKRENQSLIELCDNQEKAKQKLLHDHQVKETQVNFLDGQLASSKKQIEKLEQELKRYKNDLEKSQQSFTAGDMSLCVTPQKTSFISCTPDKYNDSKYEDLQEKYNKEVEERKRLETELRVLQLKSANQTPQSSSHSTMNHRDIARHQASSSVFSWQQDRTPSRSSSITQDTSLKRGFAATHFPWEQEEVPSKKGYKLDNLSKSTSDSYNDTVNEQLRVQNQELKSKINEMETRLQIQEKEIKNQVSRCQETQIILDKTKMDLAEKDQTLTKSKDDLARVKIQLEQATDKGMLAEQKLKKVSEELGCQRQNAESSRITVEQKLKDREKEHQQDLVRQQNSLQSMEQQLNQLKTKLSQESQQAKNQFNSMQAELDKVNHLKRSLEVEIEELKQKLSRSEQALHTCQKNESDFKKNIEEAKSEQNAIKCQFDQKCREYLKLEEDLRTANQTLRQNQTFVEELQNKNVIIEAELKSVHEKLQDQGSVSLQSTKCTILNLEKERDFAQELLKKRDQDIEEMKVTLENLAKESTTLKYVTDCKEKECKDLLNANNLLSNWKNEQEKIANQQSREKEGMLSKISEVKGVVQTHLDKIHSLENDKTNLNIQIKTLQELVNTKMADLETQKAAYNDIRQKQEVESQKLRNETEKLVQEITELKGQIEEHKSHPCQDQMSLLENMLQNEKLQNAELRRQHDELLKTQVGTKISLVEFEDTHERFVAESRSQVQSLQNEISSKQIDIESLASTIKEKDETINSLSEKLRLKDTDRLSACQTIKELNDELQAVNQVSESWSIERETLTALISCNQKDIERLTAENKRINELDDGALNCNKKLLLKINSDMTQEVDVEHVSEEAKTMLNRRFTKHTKEHKTLKVELSEMKEKYCKLQIANEELTTLVCDLQSKELSRNKILEEFRESLEEKEKLSIKLPIDTEKTNGSAGHDDGDVDMTEGVNIESVKALIFNSKDMDLCNTQAELHEETLCSEVKTILLNSENIYQPTTTTLEMENDVPLKKSKRLSLNDTTTDLCDMVMQKFDLPGQSECITDQQSAPASEITFFIDHSKCDGYRPRKSVSDELFDLTFNRSFEEQLCSLASVNSNDEDGVKQLLAIYQAEVNDLKKQYGSEIAALQQTLKDQANEMENKLSEEKKQKEHLSLELEAARLELQVLDLSARSLLSFDVDDLTKTFDATNQSICTVLPIGGLSLNTTSLQTSEIPGESNHTLHSKHTEDVKLASFSLEKSPENPGIESPKCSPNSSTTKILEASPDILKVQTVIENLRLQAQQFSNENLKLLQRAEDGEQKIETLVAELKDLTAKIDGQKSECVGSEATSLELQNYVKELEEERACLFEKLELLSSEKQQLTVRVENLEKDVNNTSNTVEKLKIQLSDLSVIRKGLEMSSEEWKEKYLQTENELRRTKSERANIENHALSLEADLDTLQAKSQHLHDENAENIRRLSSLQESLDVALEEKNKIFQELNSVNEEKEEYLVLYHQLQRKEDEFVANKANSRELIKILEDEMRALKVELQTTKSITEQLSRERDELISLQETEKVKNSNIEELQNRTRQIQDEKELLVKEIEAIQSQVRELLKEKGDIYSALECCLLEKQELATRLNSANEETALLHKSIEELKICIDSNEKEKSHVVEKLENEMHAWKLELQNAKSIIEQLSTERDGLISLQEAEKGKHSQLEELQNQLDQIQQEKAHLSKQLEEIQAQIHAALNEKDKISRSLESCRLEKQEMANRLNIAQEEAGLLHAGIEKLKIRIESDEKRKCHMIEKLKESERNTDHLKDKIENLERELTMSEENFEDAILQTEAIKEEMETLKAHKDALEKDTNNFRRKVVDLEKVVMESHEKIVELEKREMEQNDFKEVSEKAFLEFEKQLNELREQKMLSDERYQTESDKQAEMLSLMEQSKTDLLHQLERAQLNNHNLEISVEKLTSELEECKQKLDEKTQQLLILEEKLVNAGQLKNQYSSELLRFEVESENLSNEKKALQTVIEQLETKIQAMTASIGTLEQAIVTSKTLCEDLKMQLEKSTCENQDLFQKVNELSKTCSDLSDEKRKCHMIEKLKESERNTDHLKDKIENLERELTMSEENFEDAILQTEAIKEEMETLKAHKDALEKDTNNFRRKVVDLEKVVMESHEKIVELEKREMEQNDFKEVSEKAFLEFEKQLNELREQKMLSDERYQTESDKQAEMLSLMEQSKTDLLHQLERAQLNNQNLEISVEKLTSELEECKQKLDEKTQQLLILEEKLVNAGQLKNQYSSELLRFEVESENLSNEKKALQTVIEQLETKIQAMTASIGTLEQAIVTSKTLCEDLKMQLEKSTCENQDLFQKVNELSKTCSDLQLKLHDADHRVKTFQEADSVERKALDEHIEKLRRQNEESNTFLISATSQRAELEETITNLQKELDAQTKKTAQDISEFENRLLQADSKQALLNEMMEQHTCEIQSYKEKMTVAEAHLNAYKHEIDHLKANREELKQSLSDSLQQNLELNQLKADVTAMKKENAITCRNLDQWMKSCKQLEQEKGQLEEQIRQQEVDLKSLQEKQSMCRNGL
ncbi:centromere protein F isoform X2 [Pelobates fuscus]|uniref:centromere protein F isoform X2 n=1 Tax=Pelobates fuscus TaxID=191477 RepID=UPI002FE47EF0